MERITLYEVFTEATSNQHDLIKKVECILGAKNAKKHLNIEFSLSINDSFVNNAQRQPVYEELFLRETVVYYDFLKFRHASYT